MLEEYTTQGGLREQAFLERDSGSVKGQWMLQYFLEFKSDTSVGKARGHAEWTGGFSCSPARELLTADSAAGIMSGSLAFSLQKASQTLISQVSPLPPGPGRSHSPREVLVAALSFYLEREGWLTVSVHGCGGRYGQRLLGWPPWLWRATWSLEQLVSLRDW